MYPNEQPKTLSEPPRIRVTFQCADQAMIGDDVKYAIVIAHTDRGVLVNAAGTPGQLIYCALLFRDYLRRYGLLETYDQLVAQGVEPNEGQMLSERTWNIPE